MRGRWGVIETELAQRQLWTDNGVGAYFFPLGLTLRAEANHPRLIEAVAMACSGWEAAADPQGPTLRLTLAVGPVSVSDSEPAVRTDKLRLSIRGNVEAFADPVTGQAFCRVSDSHAFDDPAFREAVLDCLVLWLLTRSGRTPIHAAGFTAGRTAILLAGRSGSGKSCLALAAHAAGFPLLSDDTVYLETQCKLCVWGIPRPVHLFPHDAAGFADAPLRLRNGKRKHAVALSAHPGPKTADAAALCVLVRGERVALEPMDPAAVLAELGPPEPGFDLLAADIEAGLQRITRRGAWRLTLGRDPNDAIALLAENLPQLIAHAAS